MIRKWRLKYLEGKAEGFESFKKTLDPSESLEPVRLGTYRTRVQIKMQ
jgi:hypothetical protein